MTLDEKLFHLLLGCAIGFIAGYIVRYLQDIKESQDEIKEELDEVKEELDEVDDIVKRSKNEEGFMRFPLVADIALLVALIVTFWAAVTTGKVNNRLEESQEELTQTQVQLEETQDRLTRVGACSVRFQAKTIKALNERTTNAAEQARSNVELQRAQAAFLGVLRLEPPADPPERREALDRYFEALTKFVAIYGQAADKAEEYPYPTIEAFAECLIPKN